MNLSPLEPWVLPIAGEQQVSYEQGDGWLFERVCAPSPDVRAELADRGFVFRDKPQRRLLRAVLHDAGDLLAITPRLKIAVESAVGEIVLLRAPPAFDISHSEPRWPDTIFISVPGRANQVSALRAAENIVHEAMHLQLTILEQADPLIADGIAKMASPWRKEPRQLQGVMHGFYVFHCISAFFSALSLNGFLNAEGIEHVRKRCAQIAEELSRLDYDRLAQGMTPKGRAFLAAFMRVP